MKIRCLVIDDEPLAIKLLENHIEKINSLELLGSCQNALQAFDVLQNKKIDLLFLDIKMPHLSGIEFLKNLKHPPKVIFTTAYREFAVESYELTALDYLLKPITFERFLKAVDRFTESNSLNMTPKNNDNDYSIEHITIKAGNTFHRIPLNSLSYIESFGEQLIFHVGNRIIKTNGSLTAMTKDLPRNNFLRIHRSYIINTERITSFSTNEIGIGEIIIPIGISYKQRTIDFLEKLK